MIRRPPRSTLSSSSAASDVYKRQGINAEYGDRNVDAMPVHISRTGDIVNVATPVHAPSERQRLIAAPASEPSDGFNCSQMLCSCCCPCCIGNPSESEWWRQTARTWFCTFLGLATLAEVVLFCIEWARSGSVMNIAPGVQYGLGAKNAHDIVHGQVWRLVTCIFLHAGLFHLLFNLLAQMWLGFRFCLLYTSPSPRDRTRSRMPSSA
eukprot:TRINITY_DN10508_c0_g1_i1.p1 TRINITY_DN10508_c0_g1~~TRINITY_DN10508_c0_g1_i1.p1  ORF type:complete len:208 (-),score=38.78 TRINITY_DN10508_c0_g1_i1:88-711(-)